jgi:hypothetical protein
MQYNSCPRCNAILAPGAAVCPNCLLNLTQAQYQQPMYQQAAVATESPQEKKYRILVITLAIIGLSELVVYRIPEWMGEFTLMRPLEYLLELCWSFSPLVIALILPRANKVRVLFIVLGALYAVCQIAFYIHLELSRSAGSNGI